MGITKLGSFRQREVCFQKIGHEGLRGRSGVAPPTVKANLGDDVGARRVGNFLGAGCWGVLYFATTCVASWATHSVHLVRGSSLAGPF